ncbi:uncharacterized protein An04g07350 [Aspergillus niger]|uniref:Contig An04c0200, genomic contig n=2 Tax=Aspergillus niger TaxID=5061 RepID=A2QJK0_ASPNC|nr:uncharacterized protein An04g07350 [Aspergillus niger]CAK44735.1 unnamed protein product [Aspergillus niger]
MHSASLFSLLITLCTLLLYSSPAQASPQATTIQSDHNNPLNWIQKTHDRLGNFDAFDDEDSATLYNGTVEFQTAASDLVNRFSTEVPNFRNMNALPVARMVLQYVHDKNAATVNDLASKVTEPHKEAFRNATGDIEDIMPRLSGLWMRRRRRIREIDGSLRERLVG